MRSTIPRYLLALISLLVFAGTVDAKTREHHLSKRVITIGADYNYPPYEFADENGEPTGYTVDITHAIAEVMGFDVEITLTDWRHAYEGLKTGQFDVLQGIAFSEERAKSILFSSPHSIANQSIFARKGAPEIETIGELAGKEVIVQNASIMHEYLKKAVPDAVPIPAATHAEALRLLASGKHDFALTANLPSLYLSKELGLHNIHPVGRPVSGQRLGYGALPKNEEIIALFSEGLAILKNTGKQQEIYDKWLGALNEPKVQWKKWGQYALYTILVLIVILGAVTTWSALLRKEVEKRSRQLKEQQEQLIQADKMTSLGVLVSGVAHEINNPTGLLLLNLPILKDAWHDILPLLDDIYAQDPSFSVAGLPYPRLKQELPFLLEEMQQSSERIRNIVNDLKDFARAQPDEIVHEVDLNELIKAAIRLVEKSIQKSTDQFSIHLDQRSPKIMANPQRIEQVIINLIINACDALQGSENSEKQLAISSNLSLDQKSVYLTVRDTGNGISSENLPRLTDPFFTTKRELGGTGLGLSVSAGIIKAHKGRLTFESELEKGTTVTAILPAIEHASDPLEREQELA
ncbi:transporter substrate-binding domain-containing protein [Marinomonas mediterranea]|uniref:transporter substrate-binding domain-containing protein n=1 Tax=Marinomonas mediterranea TaxID=119864 RepID=UPI00234BAD83|nr:transporter substrate-binding domain-containing protein [Marinomonas mediterranea]WCN12662.1 transporter substrate-binding domain-containing protein [Marinomonas mediterranea]